MTDLEKLAIEQASKILEKLNTYPAHAITEKALRPLVENSTITEKVMYAILNVQDQAVMDTMCVPIGEAQKWIKGALKNKA